MEENKEYVDIAFIVPLSEEYKVLEKHFPAISDELCGTQFKALLNLGKPDLRAVAFVQDDMGKTSASRTAEAVLRQYDVGIFILIGIAGGVSDEVAIGDVCISTAVADIVDNAKITSERGSKQKIEFSPSWYKTDPRLVFSITYINMASTLKEIYSEWTERSYFEGAEKVPGEFIGRKNKNEVLAIPQIHDGTIVCGSVSKSDIYKSSLSGLDRKVLVIETEAGGPFYIAEQHNVPIVAIRGVCDYADENKSKLQEQTSGQTRNIAISNAVRLVQAELSNPNFVSYLLSRKQTCLGKIGVEISDAGGDVIAKARHLAEDEIDARLRELSPDYKTKPRGYRLPIPRVKIADRAELEEIKGTKAQSGQIVGILDALVQNDISAVEMPRGYPDNSLAWVIANELLHIEIDGLPAFPIVLSGDEISPPNSTFAQKSIIDLPAVYLSGKVRLVFIIEKTPYNSRSKSAFIVEQLKKYPGCRALLVFKGDENIEKKSDLIIATGAVSHTLTDIPFFEITDFIRRNFSVPEQEAGVIAFKLKQTFNKFNLNIHPSYFSGVLSDNLNALLDANRRAELIQLAVIGFLTFVVATDKGTVSLSRGTRERFLKKLIYELKVNLRTFDQSEIVAYTKEFATDGAFDIDPLEFIAGFVDKGILHFENNNVAFALPFIESYILAVVLRENPKDALTYFKFSDSDFDFATFDLYAELGPSEELVAKLSTEISVQIEALQNQEARQNVLLSDEIRPAAANRPERYDDIRRRLARAMEDVTTSRPNAAAKQKILDVAERVRGVFEDAKKNSKSEGSEGGIGVEELSKGFNLWAIATTLIGAASEHLYANTKAELASKIVKATTLLLDGWTRQGPPFVDAFKAQLSSEESLRAMLGVEKDEEINEAQRELVTSLIEGYEFLLLSLPLQSMLQYVGDHAGQPVLGLTISNLVSTDPMENLIASIWLAEINASRAAKKLEEAIAALPPTPFLRQCLATHLMTRVYWNHANPANQIALLDAANTSIKPLGKRFDKAQILRQIDSKIKEK